MPRARPLAALLLALAPALARADDLAADLEAIRAKHGLPALGAALVRVDAPETDVRVAVTGTRRAVDPAHPGDAPPPVTPDDPWHLGSCTKAMTATLCARLVERGKLRWTSTLAEVFPEGRDRMDPGWRGVTLRQLLAHRAGAPPDMDRDGLWARLWQDDGPRPEQRLRAVRVLTGAPPSPAPGTAFVYSNAGYLIAGAMCERVMGRTWDDLMGEEVWGPLGIRSAGTGAPGDPAAKGAPDAPRGHRRQGDAWAPVEPGPGSDNPPAIGPAGTVHMDLADWGRFVAAHLRGARGEPPAPGARPYLARATWAELHRPEGAERYALGWGCPERDWARGPALTHAGSNTMWYAVVWAAPARGFAALVVTNAGGEAAPKACDEAAQAVLRRAP